MSARTDVYDALKAGLPSSWKFIPTDADPTISAKTVMVYTERVVPGPTQGLRTTNVAVWLLTPKQTGGTDDAEAMLDAALNALDDLDSLQWSDAVYQVYADTYPGYKISLTLITDRN